MHCVAGTIGQHRILTNKSRWHLDSIKCQLMPLDRTSIRSFPHLLKLDVIKQHLASTTRPVRGCFVDSVNDCFRLRSGRCNESNSAGNANSQLLHCLVISRPLINVFIFPKHETGRCFKKKGFGKMRRRNNIQSVYCSLAKGLGSTVNLYWLY